MCFPEKCPLTEKHSLGKAEPYHMAVEGTWALLSPFVSICSPTENRLTKAAQERHTLEQTGDEVVFQKRPGSIRGSRDRVSLTLLIPHVSI